MYLQYLAAGTRKAAEAFAVGRRVAVTDTATTDGSASVLGAAFKVFQSPTQRVAVGPRRIAISCRRAASPLGTAATAASAGKKASILAVELPPGTRASSERALATGVSNTAWTARRQKPGIAALTPSANATRCSLERMLRSGRKR